MFRRYHRILTAYGGISIRCVRMYSDSDPHGLLNWKKVSAQEEFDNRDLDMSAGTSLYYPFIHPRQPERIKASLLYWDRIRRIVPDSLTHGDRVMGDDHNAAILAEHGFLIATRPERYEEEAAVVFFQQVESKAADFKLGSDEAKALAGSGEGIHVEKLAHSALHRLRDLGLAEPVGEWVAMRREVGALYMFCLASEMSRQMGTPLMTDSRQTASVGESLLFAPSEGDARTEILFKLGIRLPAPEQLRDVPMEEIVRFSEERSEEKRAFRDALEQIVDVAMSMTDPNALDDYLVAQEGSIRQAISDHRKVIDEIAVGAISSTAQLSVPTGLAVGLAALPLSPSAAAILSATGLAVAAISCVAETRGKLREARRDSPYHYLTSLRGQFEFGP